MGEEELLGTDGLEEALEELGYGLDLVPTLKFLDFEAREAPEEAQEGLVEDLEAQEELVEDLEVPEMEVGAPFKAV